MMLSQASCSMLKFLWTILNSAWTICSAFLLVLSRNAAAGPARSMRPASSSVCLRSDLQSETTALLRMSGSLKKAAMLTTCSNADSTL